jgi:predicted amidohydrolase
MDVAVSQRIERFAPDSIRGLNLVIEPYAAVALQSDIPMVRDRGDFPEYIGFLSVLADAAVAATSLECPVRLIVLPEASFQGFRDEFTDEEHVDYARALAVDIPGRETQALGRIARRHRAYVVASAKARHSEFPDRYFNVAFVLSPEGEIVHKYYKLQAWVKERSVTPHDVLDRWREIHGSGIDALFPVARLPIGNIATTICMEGSFPEIYRGLAMNGAEVITRPSYPEPWVAGGMWEVQPRARALDNTCYVVAPNQSSTIRNRQGRPTVGGGNGGHSMIIDYRGRVMARAEHACEGFVAAILDVAALRKHRQRSKFCNFIPYLRTELYREIYAAGIWPQNGAADAPPGRQAAAEATFDAAVDALSERGVYVRGDK